MTKLTRLQNLEEKAEKVGLYVRTYSPGDGMTRYRFFRVSDWAMEAAKELPAGHHHSLDYFGPITGIYTALGMKEAHTFVNGALAVKS
jgi:hypothetical protein